MTWTLHEGDCLDIMRSMPDASVDAVITDIPYGEVNRESNGLRELDKKQADDVTFDLGTFLEQVVRIVKGTAYVFCGMEQVSAIRHRFVEAGMSTRLCVWEKSNPSPMNGQHVWLSSVECCVFGKKPGGVFNEFCKSPVWRHKNGQSRSTRPRSQ